MAQGLEVDAAEEWLSATLSGDATLSALLPGGVWNTEASQGTAYPFVLFQFMSGLPYAAVGAFRIWESLIYMVKVIGETADYQTLKTPLARIDVLLHRGSGTAADGTIWACVKEQSIRLPEAVQGKHYRSSGALYRLYAT